MPLAAATLGTRLEAVMPGNVFVSSAIGPSRPKMTSVLVTGGSLMHDVRQGRFARLQRCPRDANVEERDTVSPRSHTAS